MRSKHKAAGWVLTLLSSVAVCLLPASWMLSAFGVPCNSLISDEGLRWLFHHLSELTATPLTACTLVYAMAAGALRLCLRIHAQGRQPLALATTLMAALALVTLLGLSALLPQSPLLGITGGLWPSPLLHGLPFMGGWALLALALTYAAAAGRLTSARQMAQWLTLGIRRHAAWVVAAMLLSFIHGVLHYML